MPDLCHQGSAGVSQRTIELRGVAVNNLRQVDLDLPHGEYIVFCGVSGSGKTSLALDTLYAEGQRRYIESFSLYTRQFLERLDKPAAERIDGLPAAIAVTRDDVSRSNRATIGTTTETIDYLRLLYSKVGRLVCPTCSQPVERSTPESVAQRLAALSEGTRLMIAFPAVPAEGESLADLTARLQSQGFVRFVETRSVSEGVSEDARPEYPRSRALLVIVDRLTAGGQSAKRLSDSLETAFTHGGGRAVALVEWGATAGSSSSVLTRPSPSASEVKDQKSDRT